MKDVNSNNFGLLIAYVVPGFITLWGLSPLLPSVSHWLSVDSNTAPTVSGFLFGTVFSVATGLVINAVRWHLVDPLHYATGVPRNVWKYPQMTGQVPAFQFLITNQFRYYECYANTMVAVAIFSTVQIATAETSTKWHVAFAVAIQLLLWSASRRTLTLYHERIAAFLQNQCLEAETQQEAAIDLASEPSVDQVPQECYNGIVVVRRRVLFPLLDRRFLQPEGIQPNNS